VAALFPAGIRARADLMKRVMQDAEYARHAREFPGG